MGKNHFENLPKEVRKGLNRRKFMRLGAGVAGAGFALGCGGRSMSLGQDPPADPPDPPSFVGFWHAKLVKSDGSLVFQSVVQYHPDGTEFENAYTPSITADFCEGVWKKVKDHTVMIYHIVLNHDATGTPSGYIVITQRNTLSKDGNSYQGSFTFTEYDDSNTEITSFNGTIEAHRIDFDHPFSLF
jgi:hypothetical protein